jgi:hypothetical protein
VSAAHGSGKHSAKITGDIKRDIAKLRARTAAFHDTWRVSGEHDLGNSRDDRSDDGGGGHAGIILSAAKDLTSIDGRFRRAR